MTPSSKAPRTLFRKYALYFGGLVSAALALSGLLSLVFAYFEARTLVDELQREKARGAAMRIEQFVRTIESQMRAALIVHDAGIVQPPDELHLELIRLMRQAPAISDASWIDAAGIQQAKASRTARDEIGPSKDLTSHEGVAAARAGRLYTSAVYFRHDSEPFVTLAVGSRDGNRPGESRASGAVLLAEVNLKLVWEVVSGIKIGSSGYAYVVDTRGQLIAHPDIGLVLRKTDLSALAQVRTALSAPDPERGDVAISRTSADARRRMALAAQAPIPALGWHVLVEQPLNEAFAPLYGTARRTGLLILVGVVVALGAALLLARRMSAPIRALKDGALRIGEGRLHERVSLATHDELQDLADQFNRMADRLRESYEGLEAKIAERTRQLASANDAKSRFLAAASHDLRQPAHALGLFLAQLREAGSTEERARLLGRIEASSAAVCELLDALFDISSLDGGKVTPRIGEVALQSIFDRLEQHCAMVARDKGLRMRIRPTALHVSSDAVLLERILLNLTANALRYTRDGGVLVGCRLRADRTRIEVWDTGIGIPLAEQAQIFEEFYQAHAGVGDGKSRGLGLGLAIVKRLADLLGIRIDLRSVEGKGSVFAFEVPLARNKTAPDPFVAADLTLARFGSVPALVIDDDRDARDAVAGLLASWECRVLVAADGAEALAALAEATPAVIVCDYRLANGELGTQVIARIRARCAVNIPALIVSGDAAEAAQAVVGDPGIHVLAKPLEAAKLRALLHFALTRGDSSVAAAA